MSNVGGTATMVGDPPNIIIGTALQRYLGFVDFILNLAPGVIVASIPAVAMVMWMYRTDLMGQIPDYALVLKAVQEYRITDWDLMAKSGEQGGAACLWFVRAGEAVLQYGDVRAVPQPSSAG